PGGALPDPSAALVKAVLINSARNVATAESRPGRSQGWGRVALVDVLDLGTGPRRLFVQDQHAGFASSLAAPHVYNVNVLSTTTPLKITLVWSDYPATPGANPELENDLDLTVTIGATV